jgi:hypothetical protein
MAGKLVHWLEWRKGKNLVSWKAKKMDDRRDNYSEIKLVDHWALSLDTSMAKRREEPRGNWKEQLMEELLGKRPVEWLVEKSVAVLDSEKAVKSDERTSVESVGRSVHQMVEHLVCSTVVKMGERKVENSDENWAEQSVEKTAPHSDHWSVE